MPIVGELLTALLAFFAIMNPIASLPVFLGLTDGYAKETRNRVALKALLLAFGIVAVFALAGKLIFDGFGITLPALRIAGGVIVFLIGFHMVQGNASAVQHPSESDKQSAVQQQMSVAISPLGMPLLAGPGTIATAMNLSAEHGFSGTIACVVAFALLCAATYLLFRFGAPIVKLIGQNAMKVITRLMGLILAVIGVQMLIAGLQAAFPVLASH